MIAPRVMGWTTGGASSEDSDGSGSWTTTALGAAEKRNPSPLRMMGRKASPITTATRFLGSMVRLRSPGDPLGIQSLSGCAMLD